MSGAVARRLLRRARSAALATTLADGTPYASLVTVAVDVDVAPILLLSELSDHTKNLARDPRASLLVEAASRRHNPQTGPRVSLIGRIVREDDARLKRRFLARHPDAALYAGFADFHIHRMAVERAHLVAGFGRASWLDAAEIRRDGAGIAGLAAAEEALLARLNGPLAGVVQQAAGRLGLAGSDWTVIAVDTDGIDLWRRRAFARLDFPTPVDAPDDVEPAVRAAATAADGRSAST